ncbi:MAG: hypothetical protein KDA05_10890 [Phycisphaerales bacterium]|nr:hypothetical protein [Phycisphaerales bacterium]
MHDASIQPDPSDDGPQSAGASPAPAVSLAPADAAALDALVDAAFDVDAIADESLRQRAARVAALMGLADTPVPVANRALVDVAFLRATRQPAGSASPADELPALTALLSGGPAFEPAERDRLVASTLSGIDRAIDAERQRMRLDMRRGKIPSISIRDIVSVAAVLLIAASVVWPVLSHMREQGRQMACNSNLGIASTALATYANDYQYSPPMVAGFGGGTPWWNVGQSPQQSNSANLYALARQDYVSLASLACPGNAGAPTVAAPGQQDWKSLEEISYSYQIMPVAVRITWGSPDAVVMTDRSPVILRAVRREVIDPWANSPNHHGRGQHVVMGDGSVGWLSFPEIGQGQDRWSAAGTAHGDNIWLPRPIERLLDQVTGRQRVDLKGVEIPESADDAFVGP